MPGLAGKNSVIKVGDSANTLRDWSQKLQSFSMSQAIDQIETSVLGSINKDFITGQVGRTTSVSGFWDATIDGWISGSIGVDDRTIEISPEGTATGKVKYTSTVNLSNYNIEMSNSGAVTLSVDLQWTGALTRGTH